MKEIVNISFGQTGINMGNSTLSLYLKEHSIQSGLKVQEDPNHNETFNDHLLFQESDRGAYQYRNITVDCDRDAINQLLVGRNKSYYNPNHCLSSSLGSGGLYSAGQQLGKKQLGDRFLQSFRKVHQSCDNLQGIVFNAASLGGAAGLISNSLEKLAGESHINKIPKIGYILYPSKQFSSSAVEIYNFILNTNSQLNYLDLVIPFDNESLYTTADRYLDIQEPRFKEINHMIAQIQSTVSLSMRRPQALNSNFNDLLTNLICYPRIHFTYPSVLGFKGDLRTNSLTNTFQLTKKMFEPSSQLLNMHQIENKISIGMFYRGRTSPYEVQQALRKVKQQSLANCIFQEWSPLGFKATFNSFPLEEDDSKNNFFSQTPPLSCCSLTNSLEIGYMLAHNNHKFDLLYSKRAFVHHFLSYDLQEMQFQEAREDTAALEKDYEPCRCCTCYDEEEDYQKQQ